MKLGKNLDEALELLMLLLEHSNKRDSTWTIIYVDNEPGFEDDLTSETLGGFVQFLLQYRSLINKMILD